MKLNDLKINKLSSQLAEQATQLNEYLNAQLNSFSYNEQNVTASYNNKLCANNIIPAYCPIFINNDVKSFIFNALLDETWVVFGGNNDDFCAIQINGSNIGKCCEFGTNNRTITTLTDITGTIGINDYVKVDKDDFQITISKSSDGINFITWCQFNILDLTNYNISAYTNVQLGIVAQQSKQAQTISGIIGSVTISNASNISTPINNQITGVNSKIDKNLQLLSDSITIDSFTLANSIKLESRNNIIKTRVIDLTDCSVAFLDAAIKNIEFEVKTNHLYIAIGGTTNAFTMIGLGADSSNNSVLKNLYDVSNGWTFIKYNNPSANPAIIGWKIKIKYVGKYLLFYVKFIGDSNWREWFQLDTTAIPNCTNLTSIQFGIAKMRSDDVSDTVGNLITKNETSNYIYKPYGIYSKWQGKKWDAMGDSITAGTGTYTTYWQYLYEWMGFGTINSYGISGTEICTGGTFGNAFVTRYNAMDNTADLVTIFGGTNDFGHNAELGTITSTDNATFYGALKTLLSGIITNMPNARVAIFTPLQRNYEGLDIDTANSKGYKLIQYVNAIKEVAQIYSVPVLDLYSLSGITMQNLSSHTADGIHPTTSGHERISKLIASFLESL